jgi:hypothetical protein
MITFSAWRLKEFDMKFAFTYVENDVSKTFDSEVFFGVVEGEPVPLIHRNNFLNVFGISHKKWVTVAATPFKVGGAGQNQAGWALPTVAEFFTLMQKEERRRQQSTTVQDLVKHFSLHFLIYLNNLLNPVKKVDSEDIYAPLAMVGEGIFRLNLVQGGACPDEINDIITTLTNGIPVPFLKEENDFAGMTPFGGGEVHPSLLQPRWVKTERTIDVSAYKEGQLSQQKLVFESAFENRFPDHKLAQRPLDYASEFESIQRPNSHLFDVIHHTTLKKLPKPWDNKPRPGAIY